MVTRSFRYRAAFFRHLGNLKILHLHGNNLETLPSDAFEGLERLERLYLHGNEIDRVPSDVFAGLSNVVHLHLHNNQLSALPNDIFKGMISLTDIFIHRNQLTDISQLDLADQANLRQFDVEGNKLTALPIGFMTSTPCSLRYIDVGDNEFKGIPEMTVDGVEYKLLDVLPKRDLNGCGPEDGMTRIYLDGIPLQTEDLHVIRDNFTTLERFTIHETGSSDEDILDLVANGNFPALTGFGVAENDLSGWNTDDPAMIASAFERHEKLVAVNLSDTGINGETTLNILENLPAEIEAVSFSDNDLTGWNAAENQDRLADAFSSWPGESWYALYLANTMLGSQVVATILTNAPRTSGEYNHVTVDLSGNQITEVGADWFEEWEVMNHLDLSDNQISKIDPQLFAPLAEYLWELNLDGNPLDPIPSRESFEKLLPRLAELVLPEPPATPTPEPQRLPRTGGGAPTTPAIALMMLLGVATVAAGATLRRGTHQRD